MTVRLHQSILAALLLVIVLPCGAAGAYRYTHLAYSSNYYMSGYVVTNLESWEVFPVDFYYAPCECWISQENYAGVAGILRTPSNQVAVSTPVVWGGVDAFIGVNPFRPWQVGNWVGQGTHYVDSDYYYADYPYSYIGSQTTNHGGTQAIAYAGCIVPTGESTSSQGWQSGAPTIHMFLQRLLPLNANFAGHRVTENPVLVGNDGCWHPDMAPEPPFDSVTGGTWDVSSGNYWGSDFVGMNPALIALIRQVRATRNLPMPCQIVIPQEMWLTTCQGAPVYQSHNLRLTVDTSSVYVERAGVGVSRTWIQGNPPPPPGGGDVLAAGHRLYASDQRVSSNGQYTLVYQGDGNLVLYGPGGPVWATMTGGAPGYVEMQGDGNLVVYNSAGTPVWDAGSGGSTGTSLVVQGDGNLVIYTSSGVPVWSIW